MRAFAILDGGGVKGAALAGCLAGTEDLGVEFVGYGGTSAGSIVALLAAVGFTPRQLHTIMIEEIDFSQLLDDKGVALNKALDTLSRLSQSKLRVVSGMLDLLRLFTQMDKDLGLYHAAELQRFLLSKIKEVLPEEFRISKL